MTRKSSILLPAGINPVPVLCLSLSGLVLCFFISFGGFYSNFSYHFNKITYYDEAGNRYFYESARMTPLNEFHQTFDVFRIFFICMALLTLYFFIHHFMGAKSIYLMRRLKNPLELYIRCLVIPVASVLLGIALVYLLNFIFIEIYTSAVPEEYMYPWWNENIWRDLL